MTTQLDVTAGWMIAPKTNTLFWEQKWCGDAPLKETFPRLFQITCNKESLISDMANDDGETIICMGRVNFITIDTAYQDDPTRIR